MSDKRRRPLAEISEKTDVNFVVQNLYVNSNPRFPSKGGKDKYKQNNRKQGKWQYKDRF